LQISKEERDCFLWEKMGRCYHEDIYVYFNDTNKRDGGGWQCSKCNAKAGSYRSACYSSHKHSEGNPNFSEWSGFAIIWEWSQKQIWIRDFEYIRSGHVGLYRHDLINPDNYANEIWEFLR
jgi:hypothetical protein